MNFEKKPFVLLWILLCPLPSPSLYASKPYHKVLTTAVMGAGAMWNSSKDPFPEEKEEKKEGTDDDYGDPPPNNQREKPQYKDHAKAFKSSVPTSFMQLRWSPSPYECTVLSRHIYGEEKEEYNIKKGEKVSIQLKNEDNPREFPDWEVYSARLTQHQGYKAVIYRNRAKKQMVLAYRGSKEPNSYDGISDWSPIYSALCVTNEAGKIKTFLL